MILGLLLIAAALGLTGYNFYDSYRAGAASDEVLSQLRAMIPGIGSALDDDSEQPEANPGEIEYPDYVLNPYMDMPTLTVDGKEYIGMVDIPALSLELPVLSEWSYRNLKVAPCRYSGSIYMHNAVICAHNYDRHFGRLSDLKLGDEVIFTDADGNVFQYRVKEVINLQFNDVKEMKHGDCDLTLFTCTRSGAKRVTVRCELITNS